MSAAAGSSVSTSTEGRPRAPDAAAPRPRARGAYAADLARRREAAAIKRQIGYGLVVGWILALVGGFFFYTVNSPVDWLWGSLMVVGWLHLVLAVALPQALYWPERAWSGLAQWQGKLVMAVLLTVVYFGLIWPARWLRRSAEPGFFAWDNERPGSGSAWQPLDSAEADPKLVHERQRSLPLLLAGVIAFFFRRGHFILLPILILLLVLGLVLFFVQSSALAPFIYTLF